MLRDDAIRLGFIEATEEDIERMKLDRHNLPARKEPPPKEATPEEMLAMRKEELGKVHFKSMTSIAKAMGIELDPSLGKEEVVDLLARGLSPERYKEFFTKLK